MTAVVGFVAVMAVVAAAFGGAVYFTKKEENL